MLYSTVHKHTLSTMLTLLFFTMTHIASAQLPKELVNAVFNLYAQKINSEKPQTSSEFSELTNTDLLAKSLIINDSLIETTPSVIRTENKIVAATTVAEPISNSTFFNDSTCIDLAFEGVSIVKMTEKYIEIEYSIVNKGTAPAPLFGTKRGVTDNVAIHFYFSGTPRLNRGSILAEGIYLTEGLRETKGMLAPNAVYKTRFKMPLEKKNRFYGVVILQLDAFDVLSHECDETNNVFPIVPKWY
jgi:hypothetical protein